LTNDDSKRKRGARPGVEIRRIVALARPQLPRLAVATVALYLAEGFAGIPVFAGTPPGIAGPAYFLGTTGGFLIGFIPLAFIVGYAADRGWDRSIPKLLAAMIFADAVVFALGFVWLAWFAHLSTGATSGIGPASAWTAGVANFVLADILKIALAALTIPASWALVGRQG
jgi:biotin transport system substrate-specific component